MKISSYYSYMYTNIVLYYYWYLMSFSGFLSTIKFLLQRKRQQDHVNNGGNFLCHLLLMVVNNVKIYYILISFPQLFSFNDSADVSMIIWKSCDHINNCCRWKRDGFTLNDRNRPGRTAVQAQWTQNRRFFWSLFSGCSPAARCIHRLKMNLSAVYL